MAAALDQIEVFLYDSWLDCLVEAVRKHDSEFSPEIGDAWRKTLAVGIEYMRSKY